MSAPKRYLALRFTVVFLAILCFIDLFSMLAVVGLHAYSPATIPTGFLAPMTYILAGATTMAVVLTLVYSLLSYPAHRRTILLLTLIVAGLLGAHLYTINVPSVGSNESLSGPIGQTVNDGQVQLSSTLSGSTLGVTITNIGTQDAISSLSVVVGNTSLPASGLVTLPTPTSGLDPGREDSGSWSLQAVPSGQLTLLYEHLHCYATDKNVDGCIMDEVYYVPAAQTMLTGEKCAPYADNCNMEHPFLSKAFIAAGIAIFGNNTFGWRIFVVLLGTFSIPVLFGICWSITRNTRVALYAAYLLAFETLFFVHSSSAVIDVPAIFFGLLGFFFYFSKVRWWKFTPITLAAIAFGLAALSKETAVMLVLVLVVYHLLFGEGSRALRVSSMTELFLLVFVVFAVGLEIYDSLFGSGSATNFLGQMGFILKYGASLTMTPNSQGWIDSILKTPITPLNWITYYSPIGYLITNVTVSSGSTSYSYVAAGYYGITNQFEVWLTYFWGAYAVYLWRKTRGTGVASESEGREFRMVLLALVWFLFIILAYAVLYLYGRITYPYYIIQAVPALAMGAAYFLTRSWFPRGISYIVLGGVFLWFFIFYPDKSFLPDPVRVWLGH